MRWTRSRSAPVSSVARRPDPGGLADPAVRLLAAGLGQHHLIELTVTRARRACRGEQVELPHQVELAVVAMRDLAVRPIEVLPPGHQGRVVVRPDVVEVFED